MPEEVFSRKIEVLMNPQRVEKFVGARILAPTSMSRYMIDDQLLSKIVYEYLLSQGADKDETHPVFHIETRYYYRKADGAAFDIRIKKRENGVPVFENGAPVMVSRHVICGIDVKSRKKGCMNDKEPFPTHMCIFKFTTNAESELVDISDGIAAAIEEIICEPISGIVKYGCQVTTFEEEK